MPMPETLRVLCIALASRAFLLVLIVVWRLLLRPYDTSAALNPPCLSTAAQRSSLPPIWPRAASIIERSIVWDAVYFVRIAECGYEYEQTYAFFPLLPTCLWLVTRSVFAPLVPLIGYRAVLGLSGYLINNVAFVGAAVYFYWLSSLILNDTAVALLASTLFCLNPASIFYSSIYSESLYSFFSFGGLYHLYTGYNTGATLLFTLSGLVRSNGMINAGYFCFRSVHQIYMAVTQRQKPTGAVLDVVRAMCVCVPFLVFQCYGYLNLCRYMTLDHMRPWCKARIPTLYGYIQNHYWGVGFLKYFQVKQLPNFMLASPMLFLAIGSIANYARLRPTLVYSLGLLASHRERQAAIIPITLETSILDSRSNPRAIQEIEQVVEHSAVRRRIQKEKGKSPDFVMPLKSNGSECIPQGFSSIFVVPFIYHLLFLTVTAFFIMHVQVATRFLSSSAPVYWFASYVLMFMSSRLGYLIWSYFLAYILVGSVLFSNFYPFT